MYNSQSIVLQINLKDITKKPLRQTTQLQTYLRYLNLQLIGEELWHCRDNGITVYDCGWNKLREITLRQLPTSVAGLDTKSVVIATNRALLILSTSGINIPVSDWCMLVKLTSVCRRKNSLPRKATLTSSCFRRADVKLWSW